jgi:hypothetical protein
MLTTALAACAPQPPLAKANATQAEFDHDRLQCQGQMYADRRGRSAPNWFIYESCMRGRGYKREPIS